MAWQHLLFFCGILALWSGFIIATLKWMLDQSDKVQGQRLADLGQRMEEFRSSTQETELKLERFKTHVAENYVRGEDWVRFAVTIEHKIDRLGR